MCLTQSQMTSNRRKSKNVANVCRSNEQIECKKYYLHFSFFRAKRTAGALAASSGPWRGYPPDYPLFRRFFLKLLSRRTEWVARGFCGSLGVTWKAKRSLQKYLSAIPDVVIFKHTCTNCTMLCLPRYNVLSSNFTMRYSWTMLNFTDFVGRVLDLFISSRRISRFSVSDYGALSAVHSSAKQHLSFQNSLPASVQNDTKCYLSKVLDYNMRCWIS